MAYFPAVRTNVPTYPVVSLCQTHREWILPQRHGRGWPRAPRLGSSHTRFGFRPASTSHTLFPGRALCRLAGLLSEDFGCTTSFPSWTGAIAWFKRDLFTTGHHVLLNARQSAREWNWFPQRRSIEHMVQAVRARERS